MKFLPDHIRSIKQGGVGVIPTDTIYGIVTSALLPQAVEKVYQLRNRAPDKPSIILISGIKDLALFNIELNSKIEEYLLQIWPNPVSVVLPCHNNKLFYLHRGTDSLAFRLPKQEELLVFLQQAGPIIAPSANPERQIPAETIEEAKSYFGDRVDFYVDAGKLVSPPSTLIRINDQGIETLREGAFIPPSFN